MDRLVKFFRRFYQSPVVKLVDSLWGINNVKDYLARREEVNKMQAVFKWFQEAKSTLKQLNSKKKPQQGGNQ